VVPVALFWLLVWEGIAAAVGAGIIIASPRAAFARLFALAQTGNFWLSIGGSMHRIMLGFFLALAIGIILAVGCVASKLIYRLIHPAVNVINAIPLASFVVVAIFYFRHSLATFVAFIMVMPIIFHNTYKGIRATDPALLEMARVFRVSHGKRTRYIYVKTVAPFLLSAASVGIGIAWKSGISAEMIGIARGTIGGGLHAARMNLLTADVFAWTIAIVALSYAIDKLFALIFVRERERP